MLQWTGLAFSLPSVPGIPRRFGIVNTPNARWYEVRYTSDLAGHDDCQLNCESWRVWGLMVVRRVGFLHAKALGKVGPILVQIASLLLPCNNVSISTFRVDPGYFNWILKRWNEFWDVLPSSISSSRHLLNYIRPQNDATESSQMLHGFRELEILCCSHKGSELFTD
jgi:hypothetical protein